MSDGVRDYSGSSVYGGMKVSPPLDKEIIAAARCPVCGSLLGLHPPYDRENSALSWIPPAVLDSLEANGAIFIPSGTWDGDKLAYALAMVSPNKPRSWGLLHLRSLYDATPSSKADGLVKAADIYAAKLVQRRRDKQTLMTMKVKLNAQVQAARGPNRLEDWYRSQVKTVQMNLIGQLQVFWLVPLGAGTFLEHKEEFHPCYMKKHSEQPTQSEQSAT